MCSCGLDGRFLNKWEVAPCVWGGVTEGGDSVGERVSEERRGKLSVGREREGVQKRKDCYGLGGMR